MAEGFSPPREADPRDTSRVLELLDQVERDVGAIRSLEEDLETRESAIEKRERELTQRMESHRDNLSQALEDIKERDEKLRSQRRHLAMKLRQRRKSMPRGGETGDIGAKRRELENVRQCLEAAEQEMVRKWARPWGAAIALLAALAFLMTGAVSYALATKLVKPICRATMIVQAVDADAAAKLIDAPGPDVIAKARPNNRVLLISESFHEDAALAPLTPIIRQVAAERKPAGPFTKSEPMSQVIQPPATEIIADEKEVWRVAGRFTLYGSGVVLLMMLGGIRMMRQSRHVMDDAVRDRLFAILGGRHSAKLQDDESRYAQRLL